MPNKQSPCGTVGAYQRHVRHKEPRDFKCRVANAESSRKKRLKKKMHDILKAMDQKDLDLVTLILRLRQVDKEDRPEGIIWDRVITCDIPRMLKYLDPKTVQYGNYILRKDYGDDEPALEDYAEGR